MFGRVQSGIFGDRRRRVAPAPQEAPRPFPLPLGPPRARVSDADFPLPFEDVDPNEQQFVHLHHLRYRPLAEQRAQAHLNVGLTKLAFPPKNVVVQSPGGELYDAGQIPSREQESAERMMKKKNDERFMARGGVIKSYGVGSSSIKDVIVSSRGGAGGGGKQPPKRNPTDISNEISDIDNELRRLKREKKRLQESNDPGAEDLIVEINDAIRILSQRKIRVMRDA